MNQNKKGLTYQISALIVEHPKKLLIFSFFFIAAFLPGLAMFNEKYDVRIWFMETDPEIKKLNAFERHFGNDENLVFALHSPSGIFDEESMKILYELSEKAWLIPEVLRVDSLTNYSDTYGEGDEIFVEPFIKEGEWDQDYLKERQERALAHRVLPDYLISKDGKSAMVFARLVPTLEGSPNYERIVASARELIAELESRGTDSEFHLIGEAAVNDAFREVSWSDSELIIPIMFAVIILYMLFTFRSILATVLPLVLIGTSIMVTFGICFYLGMSYNQILSILPGILVAISIADSVHMIVSYLQFRGMGRDNKTAGLLAIQKNLIPTFLTSLSTVIGFWSLLVTELVPIREMGLLAGIGTAVAWILTMTLVAPAMVLFPLRVSAHFKIFNNDYSPLPWAIKTANFFQKRAGTIVLLFVSSAAVSLWLGSKVDINSNPYDYFTEDIALKQANEFVKDVFGGNAGPELVFESGAPDGIKNPEWLAKVETLKLWLSDKEYVNKTLDIIDIVKDTHQALNGGDPAYYKIASEQKTIAEELFLYTMSLPQGMDLNNRMTLDNEAMRMSILWSVYDTRGWLRHVDEIEVKMEELGLKGHATGKFLLFQRMMDYVVMTFLQSITMAMFMISILMMILLRSFKLGVLSLLPNILPLIYGAAFMYLVGIHLNIGSALVASVCLGIAVDDTIHFLTNYYRLRTEGHSIHESLARVFTYTGSALVMTTFILVTSFGLFVIGDFVPNIHFGLLAAFVLSVALITDVVFLPALLFFLARFSKVSKS